MPYKSRVSVCLGLGVLVAGGLLATLGAMRTQDALNGDRFDRLAGVQGFGPGLIPEISPAGIVQARPLEPRSERAFTLNDRPNLVLAKIQDRMTQAIRPRYREYRSPPAD